MAPKRPSSSSSAIDERLEKIPKTAPGIEGGERTPLEDDGTCMDLDDERALQKEKQNSDDEAFEHDKQNLEDDSDGSTLEDEDAGQYDSDGSTFKDDSVQDSNTLEVLVKETKFVVSKDFFTLVPTFRDALEKARYTTSSGEICRVYFPDSNVKMFKLLLDVLQHKHESLPRILATDDLLELAQLVAEHPFFAHLISLLERDRKWINQCWKGQAPKDMKWGHWPFISAYLGSGFHQRRAELVIISNAHQDGSTWKFFDQPLNDLYIECSTTSIQGLQQDQLQAIRTRINKKIAEYTSDNSYFDFFPKIGYLRTFLDYLPAEIDKKSTLYKESNKAIPQTRFPAEFKAEKRYLQFIIDEMKAT